MAQGWIVRANLMAPTRPPWRRRQKILKEKAVPMVEGYMFEDHELIRRAATECMCNLAMSKEVRQDPGSHVGRGAEVPVPWAGVAAADQVPSLFRPQVQDLFEAEGNDRLKLLVLYSGEDDELLRRAAAGGLAMLTSMRPSLCSRIPQVVSASPLRGGLGRRARPQLGTGGWVCPLPGLSLWLGAHTAVPCRPHTGWRSCRPCS